MNHSVRIFLLTVCWSTLVVLTATAHSINLHAWTEDGQIKGEASLFGGGRLEDARIEVFNSARTKLAETKTSHEGTFALPIPAAGNLTLHLSTPDGHSTHFILKQDAAEQTHPSASTAHTHEHDHEDLEEELDRMLDQKLSPIHSKLNQIDHRDDTFQKAMTGIGFILGIFGAAALVRNRRSKG